VNYTDLTLSPTIPYPILMPLIPLHKLAQWSPFRNLVWNGIMDNGKGAITIEEVNLAIEAKRWQKEPLGHTGIRRDHVERIAYLVVHRDPTPIDLDVGVPELGCYVDWPIQDGHHRLAAAFYRGDESIEADVSGGIDYGEELLGVRLPRTVQERVLEAVRRYPGSTAAELTGRLDGLTRASVASRLSELRKNGLVQAEGAPKRYRLKMAATMAPKVATTASQNSVSRSL
jgi:hypothetical protein